MAKGSTNAEHISSNTIAISHLQKLAVGKTSIAVIVILRKDLFELLWTETTLVVIGACVGAVLRG
jgi:hypothetical protein